MDSVHVLSLLVSFFFFSSRRRHTRWPRDWSSDVCSSDLAGARDADEARGAFQAGVAELPFDDLPWIPRRDIQLSQLDQAVERLGNLKPLHKPALLKAISRSIFSNQHVSAIEAELFRALADSLDCPVPPILAGQRA